jgi:hypothetical protein
MAIYAQFVTWVKFKAPPVNGSEWNGMTPRGESILENTTE